jgi:hypothetical protein
MKSGFSPPRFRPEFGVGHRMLAEAPPLECPWLSIACLNMEFGSRTAKLWLELLWLETLL